MLIIFQELTNGYYAKVITAKKRLKPAGYLFSFQILFYYFEIRSLRHKICHLLREEKSIKNTWKRLDIQAISNMR